MRISTLKWSSVREDPPPFNVKVLVRVEDGDEVVYFEDCRQFNGLWKNAIDDCVTHWIPLPKLKCPTCGVVS